MASYATDLYSSINIFFYWMNEHNTKRYLTISWEIIGISMLIANAIFFVVVMGIGHFTQQGVYVFEQNAVIRISEIIAGGISVVFGVWLIHRFLSRIREESVRRTHSSSQPHAVLMVSNTLRFKPKK